MDFGKLMGDVMQGAMAAGMGNPLGMAQGFAKGVEDVMNGDPASQSQGLNALTQAFGMPQGSLNGLQQMSPQEVKHLMHHMMHQLEQQQEQQQEGNMPFSMGGDGMDPSRLYGSSNNFSNADQILQTLLQKFSPAAQA